MQRSTRPRGWWLALSAVILASAANAQTVRLHSPLQTAGGLFGRGLAVAPDASGDGVSDIFVAATAEREPTGPHGRVHLFSGATFQPVRSFVNPNPNQNNLFGFGAFIASAPDLNGDGLGDLLVGLGCESAPGEPACAGHAQLYSGGSGALLHTFQSDQPVFGGNFGGVVDSLDDVDSDGTADILISTAELRILIYSGATRERLRSIPAPHPVTFSPAFSSPDLDGDGAGDVLINSRNPDSQEPPLRSFRVYVHSGATGALIHAIDAPPGAPFFGQAARGIPDLDGDGRAELILPSYRMASPEGVPDVGRVYVYSGATAAPLYFVLPPSPTGGERFGWATAVAPDLDGDGRNDFVVSALFDENSTGAVYIYSGATGRLLRSIVSPNPRPGGQFGFSVGAIGYTTGVRRAAVIVGAPNECPGCGSEVYGAAYAVLICRADSDLDGRIDSRDIAHFITGWVRTVGLPPGQLPPPGVRSGDHDADGVVNTADISAFLADWLETIAAGGCL